MRIWRTSLNSRAVKLKRASRPKLEYQFPDRHITLWFWLVNSWEGEPWGKEGQPGRWIAQSALVAEDFPPANEPVITKLIQGSLIG